MDRVLTKPRELVADETTLTDRYGSFACEPLEPGWALTLGNAMRRILLSSIRGAAVTSIRIEGTLHEFTTIPGVLEDVTDIVLNVKGVTFRADAAGPYIVRVSCEGPRVVRAGDLVLPPGLAVLEPEQRIATLDRDGRLRMELTVSSGRGYVPADRNGVPGVPIDTIAVDSLHSPVLRVNYVVTESRTSSVHERLALSLWTNGAVKPADAVAIAARILQEQLLPFVYINEPLPEPASSWATSFAASSVTASSVTATDGTVSVTARVAVRTTCCGRVTTVRRSSSAWYRAPICAAACMRKPSWAIGAAI